MRFSIKTYQKPFILACLSVIFSLVLNIGVAHAFFQDNSIQDQTSYKQYRGEVIDSKSRNPLVFASLVLEGSNISTVTNTEGSFLLKVPKSIEEGNVIVSFLGYQNKSIPLSQLSGDNNKIGLNVSITELSEVNISVPKNALALVQETLRRRGENYYNDPALMTAFYRETIKKRRRNVSLSEAVVNIYKSPYTSSRNDAVKLYKARKNTDYSKLDTVALKLQGGPFNALFVDVMKYPDFIFTPESLEDYKFTYSRSTTINNRLIYVIEFKQRDNILEPMYEGKLFIDANKKVLTSAVFSLNITNRNIASRMFVRRKPRNAKVYPTEVAYRVDYREKDGLWYYGYSNALLEFKINWDKKLFNSVYSMTCEMAVTDWEQNELGDIPKSRERLKTSIILADEAIGFSDPDFWGEYNIIEPEKSIESAIRKIQRQLKRVKSDGSATP
ncbi:carboxypeptidase-like regulatory domain-containing protein [Flavobacteriaceae bacterium D16]|nr:carboxypeptidase-like regulatory domain-containing protein [Flavobacteriaceae bacterium D16]